MGTPGSSRGARGGEAASQNFEGQSAETTTDADADASWIAFGGTRDTRQRGGIALEKAVQFVTWLIPVLEHFPRSQKFLLGDRMQALAMDIIETLVEAAYTKSPEALLRRVNLQLEKQRLMVRLAYNLHYLNVARYEFAARKLDEIGQRVGAWIKTGAAHVQAPAR